MAKRTEPAAGSSSPAPGRESDLLPEELKSIEPHLLWYYHQLQAARRRLTRRRQEHHLEASALIESDPIDAAERASEETDLDLLLTEVHVEEQELIEIEAAIDRIRKGTYGICERTGRQIPWERLRALPWTRFCVEAASSQERRIDE